MEIIMKLDALPNNYRTDMIEALYNRYGKSSGTGAFRARLRFFRKKYTWIFVTGGARLLKRTIDIAAAGIALILLFPIFLLVGIAIKLTDGGPILFWQIRVGKWGQEFAFPKFRSMVVDAEKIKAAIKDQSHHDNSITFKMKKDPRVTWIGRIIRKLSVDELPQLWSVLKGDMSLVGPRPALVSEVAQYTLMDRRRLEVVPGLTSIWAISGRGDIPFDQQVDLDVQYIESRNLWGDIKILLKTVPVVLLGKGAY
jgi:lipopolysaccharide/colanic/teichoic acid biosynthesis glycosyltransferase